MNTQEIMDLYLQEFVRSGRKFNRRDIELRRYWEFCSKYHGGQVDFNSVQMWLAQRSSTLNMQSLATVQNRISDFAKWARLLDKSIGPIPRARRVKQDRRTPIILNKKQVAKFIGKQRDTSSRKGINPNTFATITGLLYTTGLRVGEALNLNQSDINLSKRSIYIPGGKGQADRTVWFSSNTHIALSSYLEWCRDYERTTDRFFIFDKVNPKTAYTMYANNFRKVAIESKLRKPKKGRDRSNFTIHDLRHSYTVNALIEIYKSDLNVHESIIELSATLGHKGPTETYWYVEDVPALVDAAMRRMMR